MARNLFYRLSGVTDPEERLEDACMWKALHDEYGEDIALLDDKDEPPKHSIVWGRAKVNWRDQQNIGKAKPFLDYWNDDAFLRNAGRSFCLTDFDGAKREVERLHGVGKGAFLKSTQSKHFILKIPVGEGFDEAMGAMAFSFIDRPPCLMVQELVEMRFERRYVVIGQRVVTSSPVAVHLTPLDTHWAREASFRTPASTEASTESGQIMAMDRFAARMACELAEPHCCLDIAVVNGSPVIIELNPMHIGQFGLFACDVRKIASASRDLIS